ncbi:MAG: DUF3830 family protein [Chloroflexi bacterium]|nr:DUF3830 family protein [Chloroflexota bacterium]
MGTRFHVRIGSEECVCELMDDDAPRLSAAFRRALPVKGFASHAKFGGEELAVMLPFWAEAENRIRLDGNVEGDVGYYPGKQTLTIFYGHVTPFGKPGGVLALLVEGKEAMRRAAQEVMDKGSLPASVFLEGYEEGQAPFLPPAVETPLTPRVRSFLEAVWSQEPADVQLLRTVTKPPMGNMPPVFYANFDLFWAGENLQTCREVAGRGDVALADLNRMTGALLDRTRRRLAHWEMPDTCALLADSAGYFTSGGPATTEEYLSITADLLVTLDRVQSWIDAMIPWAKLDRALSPAALARV